MNFFSAQDRARKYTFYLRIMFMIAIAAVVAFANYVTYLWVYHHELNKISFRLAELTKVYDPQLTIVISSIIIGFVTIASFVRLMTLNEGGRVIAEAMGGQLIPRSSNNPEHQKILNIVDEMAIASGISVPPVYVLDELGINAFAAGWKPSNSVIGITNGALKQLNRDELQGVIAHEFSHIFNGDMRLNLSLIAHLYGIVLIGETGKLLLRMGFHLDYQSGYRYRSNHSSRVIFPVIALGLSLYIVGGIGLLIGSWVKAMISRQREFLADASAVQYTRNNEGIANALKKIGGIKYHAHILHEQADIYSHGYFSQSANHSFMGLFDTHPPLEKRIQRIQPRWNGQYIKPKISKPRNEKVKPLKEEKKERFKQTVISAVGTQAAFNSIQHAGEVSNQTISIAKNWLNNAPDFIKLYAKSSPDAEWLIYALLIDKDNEIQQKQWAILQQELSEKHLKVTKWLSKNIQQLEHHYDSLVVELSMPALRQMSKNQYEVFKQTLTALIKADNKIDLSEWCIHYVITYQLDTFFNIKQKAAMSFYLIGAAKQPIETMLSLLVYIEHGDTEAAKQSFKVGVKSIGTTAFNIIDKKQINLTILNTAMSGLQQLKTPLKQKLLTAAVNCIAHNQRVKRQSFELLRTIANGIEVPLPPVYVASENQKET